MPPQSNRNAAGPQVNLGGPVQRTTQQVDLRVTPAQVDGPNMNNAKMFDQLGKALNLGVEALGEFTEMAARDDAARFDVKVAEFNNAYDKGDAVFAGYDGLLAEAGDDLAKQKLVLQSMGRANRESAARRPGVNLGTRLFSFTPEQRQSIKDSLPGVQPMAVELVQALEQTASNLPTWEGIDPRDREGMISFGVAQFKDELKQEQRKIEAANAAAVEVGLQNHLEASWFPTGIAEDGTTVHDYSEIVSATSAVYGNNNSVGVGRAIARGASDLNSIEEIRDLGNTFVNMGQADRALVADEVKKAENSFAVRRATELFAEVGGGVDKAVISVPTIFGNIPGLVEADLSSENLEERIVGMVLQEGDLPAHTYDAVAKALETPINQGKVFMEAEEALEANTAKLASGVPMTPNEQDQLFLSYGEDLLTKMDGWSSMSTEEVAAKAAEIGADMASWNNWSTKDTNGSGIVPPKMLGNMRKFARGTTGERITGALMWAALGGADNPNLESLAPKDRMTFALITARLGRYDQRTGVVGPLVGPDAVIDTGVLDTITHQMDSVEVLPEAQQAGFDTAMKKYADNHYGFGGSLLSSGEADASYLAGVDALQLAAFSSIAMTGVTSSEEAAEKYFALLADAGFFPIQQGADSAPMFRADLKRRLQPEWRKDINGISKDFALGGMFDRIYETIDGSNASLSFATDPEGLRTAIEGGEILVSMNTNMSLNPTTPYCFFEVSQKTREGSIGATTTVSIPWVELYATKTRTQIDKAEHEARILSDLQERVGDNSFGEPSFTDGPSQAPPGGWTMNP